MRRSHTLGPTQRSSLTSRPSDLLPTLKCGRLAKTASQTKEARCLVIYCWRFPLARPSLPSQRNHPRRSCYSCPSRSHTVFHPATDHGKEACARRPMSRPNFRKIGSNGRKVIGCRRIQLSRRNATQRAWLERLPLRRFGAREPSNSPPPDANTNPASARFCPGCPAVRRAAACPIAPAGECRRSQVRPQCDHVDAFRVVSRHHERPRSRRQDEVVV